MREKLSRFERACLGVIALAFLVRVTFVLQPSVIWDSAWYLTLARSFAEHGDFRLPWTDPPQYSGYWPPLFPILLSPFVKVFGASYPILVAFSCAVSAALTLAVFLTTRDLMGRARAFAAAALVAVSPAFTGSDRLGESESLVALCVVLTAWAFLKSLDKPAWLLPTAAFAALAYLSKATLGLPLVAAALVVLLAWRVWTRGARRVLTSPLDVGLALAGLAALAALAWTRTERFGGIGVGVIEPLARTITQPTFAPVLAFKLVFLAVFLVGATLPFSLKLREAWRDRRSERGSALWLATGLPLAAAGVFTTAFYHSEGRPLVSFDNVRYIVPSLVPFLWLLLPHWELDAARAPAPAPAPGATTNRALRTRHDAFFVAAVASLVLVLLLDPLSGLGTLTRLYVFLALLLVPLALALAARANRYVVAERRTAKGVVERRYEPARGGGASDGMSGGAMGALVVGALVATWFVSTWYLALAIGLVVGMASPSTGARAVTMMLVLLVATWPALSAEVPDAPAAQLIAERVPPGETLYVSEPPVYFAAVAPPGIVLRAYSGDPPPEARFVLASEGAIALVNATDFTTVGSWEYEYAFTPPLAARLAIERALGTAPEAPNQAAIAFYERR